MEHKGPLNERPMDNRPSERDERWGKAGDVKPRPAAHHGQGPASGRFRQLPPINTKRSGGYGKRGRDAQQARTSQGWKWGSPVRNKKYRGTGSGAAADGRKPGTSGGGAKPAAGARSDKTGAAGPQRLNMDRRVGGTAPNGNPQCWIAPNDSESDPHRVAQRTKQVEYGKNSAGYKAYLAAVPKEVRRRAEPQTPDVHTKCSKRCFDGILRAWRRKLHQWDAKSQEDAGALKSTPSTPPPAAMRPSPLEPVPKLEEAEPVLWDEIEKISLSTPRSWMEDVDSDLSDPESDDRVTIYTNELSPTPSEMMAHKSSDMNSELWGTPRSRLSPEPDSKDERPATPPSPYSPWAPWDASKRSFADALRSPLDVSNAAAMHTDGPVQQQSAVDDVAAPSDEATLAPPTLVLPKDEATLAPSATAALAETDADDAPAKPTGPFTFGDAFASGALPQAGASSAATLPPSFFGKGISVPVQPGHAAPSLTAAVDLEGDEHSISMRTFPVKEEQKPVP